MKFATLILVTLTGLVALAQEAKPAKLEGFVELLARAEKGDAAAQVNVGVSYDTGMGVTKDPTEALKWFHKAAEQGNAPAQYILGEKYDFGQNISKDPIEAVKWYRKAAEQGHVPAQFNLGVKFATGEGTAKDAAQAVKWYRMAAEQGSVTAQFNLGWSYEKGEGVAADLAEAAKWYRKAAEQGDDSAQVNLGWMYARGEGVAKDPVVAVNWYRMAAESGNVAAQCALGAKYTHGEGVLKDEIEALAWYNISAISGFEFAVENRDALERRLGPQAALVAQKRSKEILKQIEANKARAREGGVTGSPAQIERGQMPKSSGSGAIVSSSGYILTAAHVVADAARVSVITAQGTKPATVVRVDESNDLAVLKIAGSTYAAMPVTSSRRIRLGQVVATIGFPNIGLQGFSPKLTRGEISSLNGFGDDPRSWQISAPVQSGNSGGPLLDENGNLIGVVLAKLGLEAAKATGDLPQNVGYAVKSAYALALLEPYLDSSTPEANQPSAKPNFEDMVAKAQQSVVLILVY